MKSQESTLGFTLLELLVVIAVIGLLSSIIIVSMNSTRGKARDARRKGDLKQIQTALEMYYNENNAYPPSTCSISSWTCWKDGSGDFPTAIRKYIAKLPSDPKEYDISCYRPNSHFYVYSQTNSGQGYVLTGALENVSDPVVRDVRVVGSNCCDNNCMFDSAYGGFGYIVQ
jgi:type II secretion system protein G